MSIKGFIIFTITITVIIIMIMIMIIIIITIFMKGAHFTKSYIQ